MNKYQSVNLGQIYTSYPEWKAASTKVEEDIVITIPCLATADLSLHLKVIILKDEILISFDAFHTHFEKWDDPEPFNSARAFVEDLLNENIAIISWWHDEQWKGSSYFNVKEEPHRSVSGYNKEIIRSWKSTYNKETLKT